MSKTSPVVGHAFLANLTVLSWEYHCGIKKCLFPYQYCEVDVDYPDRSVCHPCTTEICNLFGQSAFPEACSLYCNGPSLLRKALGIADALGAPVCSAGSHSYLLWVLLSVIVVLAVITTMLSVNQYLLYYLRGISPLTLYKLLLKTWRHRTKPGQEKERKDEETGLMKTAPIAKHETVSQQPFDDARNYANVVNLHQIQPTGDTGQGRNELVTNVSKTVQGSYDQE